MVIFLIGSVLPSQNICQLIIFRGVQGLAAGGLRTLVLARVRDIIRPRERGRYKGELLCPSP
jgi:MFS family permease